MASVVANFDSTTMIGAVTKTSPASRPATGPNIRRPSHQVSMQVSVPAIAEPNRAPYGLSPKRAVPTPITQ